MCYIRWAPWLLVDICNFVVKEFQLKNKICLQPKYEIYSTTKTWNSVQVKAKKCHIRQYNATGHPLFFHPLIVLVVFWGVSESEGAFGDAPVNFNLFCKFDLNYNYNFNSNFNNDLLHRERNILLQLKIPTNNTAATDTNTSWSWSWTLTGIVKVKQSSS